MAGRLAPPAEIFKAERDGRARLTRIDGRVYLAADDASTFIEFCRLGSPAMRVPQIGRNKPKQTNPKSTTPQTAQAGGAAFDDSIPFGAQL
jgi:hypothetical protein